MQLRVTPLGDVEPPSTHDDQPRGGQGGAPPRREVPRWTRPRRAPSSREAANIGQAAREARACSGASVLDFVVAREKGALAGVRDRDQPEEGRDDAPLPDAPVPDRRRYHPDEQFDGAGRSGSLVASDHVESDAHRAGRRPQDLFDISALRHGLDFDETRSTGSSSTSRSVLPESGRTGPPRWRTPPRRSTASLRGSSRSSTPRRSADAGGGARGAGDATPRARPCRPRTEDVMAKVAASWATGAVGSDQALADGFPKHGWVGDCAARATRRSSPTGRRWRARGPSSGRRGREQVRAASSALSGQGTAAEAAPELGRAEPRRKTVIDAMNPIATIHRRRTASGVLHERRRVRRWSGCSVSPTGQLREGVRASAVRSWVNPVSRDEPTMFVCG